MWSDARQVAEALFSHSIASWPASWEVVQVAAHTFNRTANGKGASFGIARTRSALLELQANGYVRRRRSWGTPYSYWLTERGIEWLTK